MGCILYELVFKSQAFASDFAVVHYVYDNLSSGTVLPLPFEQDTLPDERRKKFVSKLILEMLSIDAGSRPAADQLFKRFISSGVDESVQLPASQDSNVRGSVGAGRRDSVFSPSEENTIRDPIDGLKMEVQKRFDNLQIEKGSLLQSKSKTGLDAPGIPYPLPKGS